MRLHFGDQDFVKEFVARRIKYVGVGSAFGLSSAIGVVDAHQNLVAGIVFNEHLPDLRGINVSFAASKRNWLTRRLATSILRYPFDQLDCIRITTLTPKRNKEARAFLDAFGFKREGLVRKGFLDDDMLISGMLRTEWETNRFNLNSRLRAAPKPQYSEEVVSPQLV